MRLLVLPLALLLAACSTTPTDLLMDPDPTDSTTDVVVSRGTFAGVGGHRVAGMVLVIRHADGTHTIRLDDLDSQAGPDLKVWLVRRFTGDVVDGHASLGPLRSTRGDQNYAVPAGVDPTAFVGVSIWCEQFGVGFGAASLVAEG